MVEEKAEWICAYCGAQAHSKCPSQRNVFPLDQVGASLSHTLAIQVIHGPERQELFLNMTDYTKEANDAELVNWTITRLHECKTSVIGLLCDHHYVLNSNTRKKCSMGCDHHNLKDIDRLNEERKAKPPKTVSYGSITTEAAEVASNAARQAAKLIRSLHYEEEYADRMKSMDRIQSMEDMAARAVYTAVKSITADGSGLPKYKVRLPIQDWSWRELDFYKLEDAKAFLIGFSNSNSQCLPAKQADSTPEAAEATTVSLYRADSSTRAPELYELDRTTMRYVPSTESLFTVCEYCSQQISLGEPSINNQYHIKCYASHTRKLKVCNHGLTIPIPAHIEKDRDSEGHDWYDHYQLKSALIRHIWNVAKMDAVELIEAQIRGWYKTGDAAVYLQLKCSWYDYKELERALKDIH